MNGAAVAQTIGALVMVVVLLDVFLTVLYARIGAGIISNRVSHQTWKLFRVISRPFGQRRGVVLSYCGPTILVLLVMVWAFGLTVGAALIFLPALGTAVRSTSGPTPTDFITALFAGGSSLAIVSSGNFIPQTGAFRLIYLVNSLIGASILSLTLTYLMQVYSALSRRNALGLKVNLLAAETGDAAELIAGLGPEGQFSGGYANLSEVAMELTSVNESHQFYPVLFYYRFHEPHYSVARCTMLSFDAVTLIKCALDDRQFGWLKESAALTQLWRSAMTLITTLEETFLTDRLPDEPPPDPPTEDRWRKRYFAALRRLKQAGIETIADEQSGADLYVSLRTHWEPHIATLARWMVYSPDEIDPVGRHPEVTDQRPDFRARLRSVV